VRRARRRQAAVDAFSSSPAVPTSIDFAAPARSNPGEAPRSSRPRRLAVAEALRQRAALQPYTILYTTIGDGQRPMRQHFRCIEPPTGNGEPGK
jgi:hypothetical protein